MVTLIPITYCAAKLHSGRPPNTLSVVGLNTRDNKNDDPINGEVESGIFANRGGAS